MVRKPTATKKDLRRFRRIRSQQDRRLHQTLLRNSLALINRALGRPWRSWWRNIQRASHQAMLGIQHSGSVVQTRDGTRIATQFLQIFWGHLKQGICVQEYYLYQLYLPKRWRSRARHFPSASQSGPALRALSEHTGLGEAIFDKFLFSSRCKEAGLPSIPTFARFVDGRSDGNLDSLPAANLFSKPTLAHRGIGANAWRFDNEQDCYFNVATEKNFSRDALFDHLCNASKPVPVILQPGLRNHPALLALSNGALSTLRLITCRSPAGSIDLMPPVLRMPVGRMVVDNFYQGGLAAPVDLATGIIIGPALQKDDHLTWDAIWIDRHPDTGQKFEGFTIPMWGAAVALARRAHELFPSSLCFVGWDLACLQHGWVLVEGTDVPVTDLTVLPHGLSLSDTQFIPYFNFHWTNATRPSPGG